jgi:hypothetical protein
MPANYNGNPLGRASREVVTLALPTDGDARNAESVNAALRRIADTLKWIEDQGVFQDVTAVIAAALTLNGAAGDTNAALKTTAVPTNYKLLWDITGGGGGTILDYPTRLYSSRGGLHIVQGASWNGVNWVRDSANAVPSRINLQSGAITVQNVPTGAAGSTFSDANWGSGGIGSSLTLPVHSTVGGNIQLEAGTGRITAPGAIDTAAATAVKASAVGDVLLTGVTYPKRFPLAPSSTTLTALQAAVNCGARSVTNSNQWGCTVTATASAAGIASFQEKLTVS